MEKWLIYKGGSLRFNGKFLTEEEIKNMFIPEGSKDYLLYKYGDGGDVNYTAMLAGLAETYNLLSEDYSGEFALLDRINEVEKYYSDLSITKEDPNNNLICILSRSLLKSKVLNLDVRDATIMIQQGIISFKNISPDILEEVKNRLIDSGYDFLVPLEYKQNTVNENVEKVA